MPLPKEQQFLDLFLANQHRIYRFIVSAAPRWIDAEEIFQQTCLTLWERWDQYDAEGEFVSWACSIAIGHLRNHIRKKQNHQVLFQNQVLEQLATVHSEQQVFLESVHDTLRACLNKLPADAQRILVHYYDGQTGPKVVAEREGKSLNVVYKLVRKIRGRLYDCMTRNMAGGAAS
ncbi:sigma-70 family RNA polymerase sigma factor [Planctomicrobium sp. SH661]|uniref:sigma-70 family RNA polymerase sigma factor n=1 Tax=Planctomicrobium sp. SH661 TaxID=3448124 RepID=UPI003F5CB294